MSEDFAELLLDKDATSAFARFADIPEFFRNSAKSDTYCREPNLPKMVSTFFGIPNSWQCLHIEWQDGRFIVRASPHDAEDINSAAAWQMFGVGKVEARKSYSDGHPVVVYLPDVQTIFPRGDGARYLAGPDIEHVLASGVYYDEAGQRRAFMLETFPGGFRLSGYINGTLVPDILH